MAPILQRPAYSAGTISITSGGVVTGVGTNFISPDGTPGWTISRGDQLFCAGGTGWVDTITDATHLTLVPWFGGAVAAGAAYRIDRNSGLPNSAVAGLVQGLLARGGDLDPFGNLVIDGGTTRGKFTNAIDGAFALLARLSSDSDYSYIEVLNASSTGVVRTPGQPAVSTALGEGWKTIGSYVLFGALGSFVVNRGGFTSGTATGGITGAIVIPETGLYRVDLGAFFQTEGRIHLGIDGAISYFLFVENPTAASVSKFKSAMINFTAGQKVHYANGPSVTTIFTNMGYTSLALEFMG